MDFLLQKNTYRNIRGQNIVSIMVRTMLIQDKGGKYMRKTSYKALVTGIVIVVVLAALLLYFRQMDMSDLINGDQNILITRNEFGVQNGEPYINYENYNDLTDDQKQDIVDLFQRYTYRRTPGTLFSDGSLSGMGDELINIYIYEGTELVRTVTISDTGDMSVNNRNYVMQESLELIHNISGIINK